MKLFLLFVPALTLHPAQAQLFDYDKSTALHFTATQTDTRDGYRLSTITFDTKGGQAGGYLVEPTSPGRHAAIVWMHSSGPINWLPDAILLAHAGAVSLIVDAPSGSTQDTPEGARDGMINAVVAIRRAVDVLETRANVDAKRIGYAGHSFGAMMGADAVSVDPRFRAAVFEVGLLGMDLHIATSPHPWAAGVRKNLGDQLPGFLKAIEPLNTSHFLPSAHIPLLFQSARYDPGVPEKDSLDFFNIANQPKELKWYPAGHEVSDIHAIADRARFLARHLSLRGVKRALTTK